MTRIRIMISERLLEAIQPDDWGIEQIRNASCLLIGEQRLPASLQQSSEWKCQQVMVKTISSIMAQCCVENAFR